MRSAGALLLGSLATAIMTLGSLLFLRAPATAPIPPHLEKCHPEPLVGPWRLCWGHTWGTATLDLTGAYRASWGGQRYAGTWFVQGNTLEVMEATTGGATMTWRVRLRKGEGGYFGVAGYGHGLRTKFRLEREGDE